jgi:hypothetical protein
MVVIDAAALSAKTHMVVKAIRDEQQNSEQEQRDAIMTSTRWRQEDRAQDILRWMSAADYGTQQSDFFQHQQSGTGQWLLDSAEYKNWCGNDATMLSSGVEKLYEKHHAKQTRPSRREIVTKLHSVASAYSKIFYCRRCSRRMPYF